MHERNRPYQLIRLNEIIFYMNCRIQELNCKQVFQFLNKEEYLSFYKENTHMAITFREMLAEDWASVAKIYQQGIETGNATFQKEPPAWEDWDKEHLKKCRIVATDGNTVVGWVALTPISGGCVFAGVAELSIYISNDYKGQKIGSQLLEKLILASEQENIWTLQAGIFPENLTSIAIHELAGFRKVGYREKISKMNGMWRDIVLLERRSQQIGLD